MLILFLFIIGLAIGSFLNVVAFRYDPERSVFHLKKLGGRSMCLGCKETLKWYDLVPLLSYLFLLGRCRYCKDKISPQYPIVEFLSGLAFLSPVYFYKVFGAANFLATGASIYWLYVLSAIWVLALLSFILLSVIDFRLYIIPDEINVFIGFLGIVKIIILYLFGKTEILYRSFLGGYAYIFGLENTLWLNHLAAAIFGVLFFGIIIYVTKGAGMGMGDMKLAGALGMLFGWPDIILLIVLSFITGSIFGLIFMAVKKEGLKAAIPFGPFIVLGGLITMFFGESLLKIYFNFFNL